MYGFIYHRIWSTKWWRDAEGEFDALRQFIDEKNKENIDVDIQKRMKVAFTDEIIIPTYEKSQVIIIPAE